VLPLLPSEIELTAVYPNPFNNVVQIQYALPEDADIRLVVYDMTGREIAVLFSGGQAAGTHQTFWSSQGVASGSYVLCLESSGVTETQKLVHILNDITETLQRTGGCHRLYAAISHSCHCPCPTGYVMDARPRLWWYANGSDSD